MTKLTKLELQVYNEATEHIFSIDADVYRQLTGRSLTDVQFVHLVGGSSQRRLEDDNRVFGPVDATRFAVIRLYECMKQQGIEYGLGLKIDVFPYGAIAEHHGEVAGRVQDAVAGDA